MQFRLALRNILRNRRRSLMTASLVAIGSLALLLFGSFVTYIYSGLETGIVQSAGHLTVYRSGYFLFGAGNPAEYGIDDYEALIATLQNDAALRGMINVITPTQEVVGIAGNYAYGASSSKPFFGLGLVGSDLEKMRQWDEHHAGGKYVPDNRLNDPAALRGVIGRGLARILDLCERLHVSDCQSPDHAGAAAIGVPPLDPALAALARGEQTPETKDTALPKIDLLSASTTGMPNIVSLEVAGVDGQAEKELDDSYVAMPLALAQQLVYGRGQRRVTGIVLQLHHTADVPSARARITALLKERHLPLEIRDYQELNPFFTQVVGMFSVIFLFLALIMVVIVLFAVVNTMTMNVLERTSEIGTVRALGVRRAGVLRLFLLEGAGLGALGATLGVMLAFAAVWLVDLCGIEWTPPGEIMRVSLRLDWPSPPELLLGVWFGLVLVATLAALPPANRAARLRIVDALRHV